MTHKPDLAAAHPPVMSHLQPTTVRMWTCLTADAPGMMRGESMWTCLAAKCPWCDERLEGSKYDMSTRPPVEVVVEGGGVLDEGLAGG